MSDDAIPPGFTKVFWIPTGQPIALRSLAFGKLDVMAFDQTTHDSMAQWWSQPLPRGEFPIFGRVSGENWTFMGTPIKIVNTPGWRTWEVPRALLREVKAFIRRCPPQSAKQRVETVD